VCQDENGEEPFSTWYRGLDPKTRAIVSNRIDRVEDGNFGDVRSVGEGVSELRIDYGPGYRVYFGQIGNQVHLITGGFKNGQQADINWARRFWRDHD